MADYVPIIVCTPGGASDNAYTDLTGAAAYYGNTLRSAAWNATTITDLQREQALIQATNEIEALGGACPYTDSPARVRFPGSPYNVARGATQALHFPTDRDLVSASGGAATLQVPADVVAAVCEQALWLLQQQATPALVDHDEMKSKGVKSWSVDGLSVTYGSAGESRNAPPEGIAPKAWAKIQPLIITMRPTR